MASLADDEMEALEAIYCRPGELSILHGADGSKQVKVILSSTSDVANDSDAELCFMLPAAYPSKPPEISVLSNSLSRNAASQLRSTLSESAARNLDQAMLMELVSLASDELHKVDVSFNSRTTDADAVTSYGDEKLIGEERHVQDDGSKVCDGESESALMSGDPCDRVALLHLDHMRARTQYVKLIRKWVVELSLTGRLVFCQRLILVLLQGPPSAIKEYIVRQRTSNVDVDSRGHPCKERMMSVLCDIPLHQHHVRLKTFEVTEVTDVDCLEQLFTTCNLHDLFLTHVKTAKHFPGK